MPYNILRSSAHYNAILYGKIVLGQYRNSIFSRLWMSLVIYWQILLIEQCIKEHRSAQSLCLYLKTPTKRIRIKNREFCIELIQFCCIKWHYSVQSCAVLRKHFRKICPSDCKYALFNKQNLPVNDQRHPQWKICCFCIGLIQIWQWEGTILVTLWRMFQRIRNLQIYTMHISALRGL